MKKTILFIFILSTPLTLSGQWYGDGNTPLTAYYGEINSSNPMQPWNTSNYPGGVIYVGRSTSGQNDLVVGTGGTLTIEQGITVKFCTTLSDLRITDTGILNASASSTYGITFTKDTQPYWGHISFEFMTTTNPENYPSVINNCLIQWGDVSSTSLSPANPNQYGGAIHVDFSYVTISNCEFSNNKAGWGGGIFVGNGKNPKITNCYIHNNATTTSGGGIYFWTNSYSVFSNSIVSFNSCTGNGGGGGVFLGGAARGVQIVNCVISQNGANNPSLGHNVKIFNNTATPKPQFINSIIWNPANSIVYTTSTPISTDFIYCAIQDPPLSTYTGCISLNSTNEGTNPDGPFFASMSGSNWPLQFRSPCRDAGTTPSPEILNDYIGNSRIGSYDIGAYEVQYSRWKTTPHNVAAWDDSDNWEEGLYPGASGSTGDVVIPPLGSSLVAPNISVATEISSGKYMVLESGGKATFSSLSNSGTLRLESDADSIASLILGSYTDTGNEEIQLFLTGGGTKNPLTYKWHYISSPVVSLSTDIFTAITPDLAQFIEGLPVIDPPQGWVAYDGYIYSSGLMGGPTFNSLIPGKGYNYFDFNDHTYTISGTLNTGDVSSILSYTKTAPQAYKGYNLLGNPFSAGLDWDYIITHSFPDSTSKALYFTRNSVWITYINGVGNYEDVTGIIPPMQGFFTKTNKRLGPTTLILHEEARVLNSIHQRYKGTSVIPLVRLALTDDTVQADQTVVRFDDLAKSDLDYDFDGEKISISTDPSPAQPLIYTSTGGVNYSINGIPFPETTVEIPVVVNLLTDGSHKISAIRLQGLDNYKIILKDIVTSFEANLKTTPELVFYSAPGKITDRFLLIISFITPGVNDLINATENIFNIYPYNGLINIIPVNDEWSGRQANINLIDLAGKTVASLKSAELVKNTITNLNSPRQKGMYMVEIRSGMKRYVGKVMIK